MVIQSTRLGELSVPEDLVFQFPNGLPGFNDEHTFALVPHDSNSPFAFLQSAKEPDLTFLVVEPFVFFADYEFELPADIEKELQVKDGSQIKVYCIVTIKDKMEEMTANLLAPLIINMETKNARQVVLEGVKYLTRHRLFPEGIPSGDGREK